MISWSWKNLDRVSLLFHFDVAYVLVRDKYCEATLYDVYDIRILLSPVVLKMSRVFSWQYWGGVIWLCKELVMIYLF